MVVSIKMTPKFGLIMFLLFVVPYIESGYVKEFRAKRLNEYISHYETLNYDDKHLHASHNRAKRSVTKDSQVILKFKAHGSNFHIRLKRDTSTFNDNILIESTNGPINVDSSHIYHGEIIGEPHSFVFGSIHDGVFEGKIISEKDSYYVEKAKHYFPNQSYIDEGFHSVIYNEKDVNDPYTHQRKGHFSGCGITEDVAQWMDNIQNSISENNNNNNKINLNNKNVNDAVNNNNNKINNNINNDNNENKNDGQIPANDRKKEKFQEKVNRYKVKLDEDFKFPYQKYTKEANWKDIMELKENINNKNNTNNNYVNDEVEEEWHRRSHERVKRATRPSEENRNTCSLSIQTDPLIWRHIREGIADKSIFQHDRGKKNEIDEKTREEILSLIAHHVTAVNYIYRNTKFDGRVQHRNIRFEVQRIKIDDDSACSELYNSQQNPFCMENIDVSNFLNIHSLGNHEVFCLAYVFTYRDFTGGTLGLAWVASASGASGGICEKYKTYTETSGGVYQSTKRSLNTGIITFVNYNSRVPPKVSQLTLAHEIGHNFGSPHDFPQECRPGGVHGNYIMFASATSGDRPNNSKFSTCSIKNISNVLDAIEDNKKRNCFLASEGAFCGNKIVESGEECDCGFNDEECQDKCCYPRLINENDLSLNATAKGCTRRARTQCSPSQGPCCQSDSCSFVPAYAHQICKEETECSWSSACNGTTFECPEPKPRDNKTKCNNGTQLCISGECSGSICLLWNMTECFLTSTLIPNIDKRKLCELACQNGTDNNSCRSTSEFADLYSLPQGGISLRPGSPCDNFQGYCDVFLRCRAVDAEGPLVRLKNLLFNKKTLLTVAQWITENWYSVVLMGIGFIIFLGMFIKCCAVHTPSSNPKKPPARRISDTLRRPMNTLRRMRHHGGAGPRSVPPPANDRSRNAGGGRGGAAGGAADRSRSNGGNGALDDSRRPPPAVVRQPGGPRVPPHGYGEGRGQHHYPPKATAPPVPNYSRPASIASTANSSHHNNNQHHHPGLYADAYPDRNSYELPAIRQQQPSTNKV